MCEDRGSGGLHPAVSVGVVPVPVGIDDVFDRASAEALQGRFDLRLGDGDAGVDHEDAVGTGQHGDVAAGPFKYAHVPPHAMDRDLRRGRRGVDLRVGARALSGRPGCREAQTRENRERR